MLALGSVLLAFLVTTVPFTLRALPKDPVVGCLSPLFLACRAVAQCLGVAGGLFYLLRRNDAVPMSNTVPRGSHQL